MLWTHSRTTQAGLLFVLTLATLAARLQARAARMTSAGEKWAAGAKECRKNPPEYMALCRKYLAKLDTKGWNRSYHQRLFHKGMHAQLLEA